MERKLLNLHRISEIFGSAEDLLKLALSLLYALILYIFLGQYILLPEVRALHIVSLVWMLLVLHVVISLRGLSRTVFFGILMTAVVLAGSFLEWKNFAQILKFYPKWLFGASPKTDLLKTGAECIQSALLAVPAYGVSLLVSRHPIPKAVISAGFFAGLVILMVNGVRVPHLGSVIVITLLVISAAELIRTKSPRQKKGSSARFLIYLMPVFILYGGLVFSMPAPEKPYDWATFRDAYHTIEQGIRKLSQRLVLNHGRAYSFSYSGFSEDSSFSGNVRSSDQDNLVLRTRDGLKTGLYLEGRIMDQFDGRAWETSKEAGKADYSTDSFLTFLAVTSFDPDYPSDYLSRRDLEIEYRYLKTDAVFMPQKAVSVDENGETIRTDAAGNLYFKGRRGYGTAYTVKFSLMNLGSGYFSELLQAMQGASYEEEFVRKNYYRFTSEEPILSAEELESYEARMHALFGGKTELSEGLLAYLSEVTKGTEPGSYERLKRLEELLSAYSYDTSPGRLPREIDSPEEFLDYFLLEKRSGFCSYFATAFALLARNEGFPARYVQGFLIPAAGESEITVRSSMSHAWPEVFIDGIGWIPFEPTPGFSAFRYAAWKTQERKDGSETASGDGSVAGMPEEIPSDPYPFDPGLVHAEEKEEDGFPYELLFRALRAAGWALLFLLGFSAVLLLFLHLLRIFRYRSRNEEGKYLFLAERLLNLLSVLGVRRRDSETLRELSYRASEELSLPPGAFSFLSDYEALKYDGSFRITDAYDNYRECEKHIFDDMRKKRRFRLLLFRLLYG